MKTINQLDENSRYWLTKALRWADEYWSDDFNLLKMPEDDFGQDEAEGRYTVRETIWYAMGLLMRQHEGDVARALLAIESVLTYQFDESEAVYHGTFFRYHNEPHPRNNPTIWRGYDPNWREFICTIFIILLKEFDTLLPDELQEHMQRSIQLAAQGAFERKVVAEYTNISLMSAFLLDYAGEYSGNSTWRDYALSQVHEIDRLFNRYKTFNEYNSPTYYGVDFYALALWREYGSTSLYRELGSAMEAALWRDMVQFYHAGMRNICGPYDRSYGMDMTDYIAVVGLWIAVSVPLELAPLPDVDQPFDHPHDYYFVPLVAMLGPRPPDDALLHLTAFQGERFLERTIEPHREVTAWLSDTLMLGAEADSLNETRTDQFHPATAHWQAPDGSISWLRLRCESLIQASVKPYELQLSSDQDINYVFEVRPQDVDSVTIQASVWMFPDMTIHLKRPDTPFIVNQKDGVLTIQFKSSEAIKLTFSPLTDTR